MTRLVAIKFCCRHWLAWPALLLLCDLAAFGSIPKVGNTEHSARGLISHTNQLGFVARFGYDAAGRRTAVTNASSQVLLSTYNAANDVIALADGLNQTTSFGYDPYGRLTSKTNALGNEILRFAYDAAGRMTNRWTTEKGNTAYTYDGVNNLTNINYATSADITFGYNALHRVTSMVQCGNQQHGNCHLFYRWIQSSFTLFHGPQRRRSSFSLIIPNASTHGPPTSSAVLVNLRNVLSVARCARRSEAPGCPQNIPC